MTELKLIENNNNRGIRRDISLIRLAPRKKASQDLVRTGNTVLKLDQTAENDINVCSV